MAKKSKKKPVVNTPQPDAEEMIAPEVEALFKKILKIMSWVVGVCFTLIITLPNFDFAFLDISIKIIFYIGVLTLMLFIVIELFGDAIKMHLSKTLNDKRTVAN